MFTGIIDHCGIILAINKNPHGLSLKIKTNFRDLELGESIAVNGICLTVAGSDQDSFSCDLSPETLNVTTAKNVTVGQKVNLERALQPISRLGGHFVMGHVDQMGQVKKIQQAGDFTEMVFTGAKQYIVHKGSIAIDGVSLTVNRVEEDEFSVMLIPHTLERTTLSTLQIGDHVNLEFDMMIRVIVEQCKKYL